MIIVSGCPRSGTSLTMNILHEILGEERIRGKKFPNRMEANSLPEDASKRDIALRYSVESGEKMVERKARGAASRALNPNGFFEDGLYSVKGIFYNHFDREALDGYLNETDKQTCMKIVSQGLLPSDPRFIDRIVYLIRDPHAVAKSQENLVSGLENVLGVKVSKEMGVNHSPEMYINVTVQAAQFFLANPSIPVHFVEYDVLVGKPEAIVKGMCDFIGEDPQEGWEKSKNIVDPKLKRSMPRQIEHELWADADVVYDLFRQKKYQEILDYFEDEGRASKKITRWNCPRKGGIVGQSVCKACTGNPTVRANFKKTAVQKGVDWRSEPCVFECGMDDSKSEADLKTIRLSIESNFWEG